MGLDIVVVIMEIEDEFDVNVTECDEGPFWKTKTVGELCAVVETFMKGQPKVRTRSGELVAALPLDEVFERTRECISRSLSVPIHRVTMHARLSEDLYSAKAFWDGIKARM